MRVSKPDVSRSLLKSAAGSGMGIAPGMALIRRPRDGRKIGLNGMDASRTDQFLDLKEEGIECGEIDGRERAQKDPARNQAA